MILMTHQHMRGRERRQEDKERKIKERKRKYNDKQVNKNLTIPDNLPICLYYTIQYNNNKNNLI